MNNRNLGILIAVIIVAAAAIGFALYKKDQAPASTETASAEIPANIEPTAGEEAKAASAAAAQPSAEDPVVAKVDGHNVLRSEVVAFIRNFPPQLQQLPAEQLFPMALDQVVAAKIVDAKASKEASLPSDPEVLKREADAKTQIIRTVYLEKEIEKRLTEDRIQKAYDKFKAEQGKIEEVHARHILVDSKEKADELIKKLSEGAKFEDLAKANSKDTANKDNGGDLGYFTKEAMVKDFADAVFAAQKGQVVKTPVKTQFGFHVVEVLDKRARPVPALEQIKPQLAAEVRREILNEMVEEWRKGAKVETFDINGQPIKKAEEKKPEAAKK